MFEPAWYRYVVMLAVKNAPKFSPKFLSLCSVDQKKSRKIPSKFPTKFSKFPCEKSKKFTDELLQERREK